MLNEDRIPEPVADPDYGGLERTWLLARYGEWRRSGYKVLPFAGGYDDQPSGWWIAVNTLEAQVARRQFEHEQARKSWEYFERTGKPLADYKRDFATDPRVKTITF